MTKSNIAKAITVLRNGGVIAYPTEAVYGLGCDPFNEAAVKRIATIKNRSLDKGFIVIASEWQQVTQLITTIDPQIKQRILANPVAVTTWIIPVKSSVPDWIRGTHQSLAIRITQHPTAKAICDAFGAAIISTSANRSGEAPIRDFSELEQTFIKKVDYFVTGNLGKQSKPSEIRDAISNQILRS